MMKKDELCTKHRPHLQRYADGELSRDHAAEVRSHLMDCLPCRTIAGEVYLVRKCFEEGRETEVSAPAGFAAAVAAKAFAEPFEDRETREVLPFIKRIASLAAGIILAAGLYFVVTSEVLQNDGGLEVEAGGSLAEIEKDLEALSKEKEEGKKPKNK